MVSNVPKLACKTFLRDYTNGMKVEALANSGEARSGCRYDALYPKARKRSNRTLLALARQIRASVQEPRRKWRSITSSPVASAQPVRNMPRVPAVRSNPEFIGGPAAIALAHRYNEDQAAIAVGVWRG